MSVLTHLQRLDTDSIDIMREAAGGFSKGDYARSAIAAVLAVGGGAKLLLQR